MYRYYSLYVHTCTYSYLVSVVLLVYVKYIHTSHVLKLAYAYQPLNLPKPVNIDHPHLQKQLATYIQKATTNRLTYIQYFISRVLVYPSNSRTKRLTYRTLQVDIMVLAVALQRLHEVDKAPPCPSWGSSRAGSRTIPCKCDRTSQYACWRPCKNMSSRIPPPISRVRRWARRE